MADTNGGGSVTRGAVIALVGAVLGAGIGAVVGWWQTSAEIGEQRRINRQEAYATFVASANEELRTLDDLEHASIDPAELDRLQSVTRRSAGAVDLLGPTAVRIELRATLRTLRSYRHTAAGDEEARRTGRSEVVEAMDCFIAAARSDLDLPPVSGDPVTPDPANCESD